MDNGNRRIRKCFKCNKCKEIETQLVHPSQFKIKCSKCSAYLKEIPEKEYKKLKKKIKINNEESKFNNYEPIRPSGDIFKNMPEDKNNIIRENNNNQNNQRNRFNNTNNQNNSHNQQRGRRFVSTNHYSDMNMNNINDNNRNQNNFNNINNINSNNFINNQNNNSNIRNNNHNRGNENNQGSSNRNPREHGHGARNRNQSANANPISSFFNNLFGNLFEGFGISNVMFSDGGPFRIVIQNQNVPQNIFDPIFLSFGSAFNESFRNNFSSNFRSNFRGDFINEIINLIERNQEEAARNAHPPTSENILKKLKKFPMSDKYCKKNKKGKIELPNCCICISEIAKSEQTVLLPCGHMFHWECCLNWLKTNNTCPMCRFELKE